MTNSNVATVSITVTAPNTAPMAQDQSVTTPKNTAKALTLGATDADGDPLTFTNVSWPAHGALNWTTVSNVTYTPATDYTGTDSFTFVANDGQTNSNVATVSIAVTAGQPPGNVLMYEGFDYPLGTNLNARVGGTGWGTNAWQSTEDGATMKSAIVAGLTFSDYVVSGNALQLSCSNTCLLYTSDAADE